MRPQLLDRFGLSVEVHTPTDSRLRVEVVRRREQFEGTDAFMQKWTKKDDAVRRSLRRRVRLPTVHVRTRRASAPHGSA